MAQRRDVTAYVVDARRQVRAAFDALPIFRRPREQALYHYCAVLDVEGFKAGTNLFPAGRAAVESSIRAIPAIYERCVPRQSDPQIDRKLFSEAHELFAFSRRLEQVEFSFDLADKGQFDVHVAKRDPRITFTYRESASDIADTLRRSGELLERLASASAPADTKAELLAVAADTKAILDGNIWFTSPESIAYDCGPELLGCVSRWAKLLENEVHWRLRSDISLGTFSLGDIHRFWAAVLAVASTHDAAHLSASGGDCRKWPIGSRVDLRSKEEWVRILSTVSGLESKLTAHLVEWLTFDPRISCKMPPIQPFLEITPGRLCPPYLFLATSDFERNFLKLLNRHPALLPYAEAVKKFKEPLALEEIMALFPSGAFRTRPQVVLAGRTDADLVIYEYATGWAVVLQHKWLIGPDTASESASNDDELNKGVSQAVVARDYWRKEPDAFRKSLSLPANAPLTMVEACVVCRGSEPTGFFAAPRVPVVSEAAFVSLLNRDRCLPGLWRLLNTRPDLVEAAAQLRDVRFTIELAGYEFVMPGLSK